MPEYDLRVRQRIYAAELGAYLLIVMVALFGFWRLEEQQAGLESSHRCTEVFFDETIRVLNSRTSFTTEVQKADQAQQEAWADYVEWQLELSKLPPEKLEERADEIEEEEIQRVTEYFQLVKSYLNAVDAAEQVRINEPYPNRENYRKCLDN